MKNMIKHSTLNRVVIKTNISTDYDLQDILDLLLWEFC